MEAFDAKSIKNGVKFKFSTISMKFGVLVYDH